MQDLDELHNKATTAAAQKGTPGNSSSQRNLEQHYTSLYETLLEHGFDVQHVQAALAALHSSSDSAQQQGYLRSAAVVAGTAAAGLEAALDWLCLNVPAAQLPRRFTGSSAAQVAAGSAGVKVRGPG
jgi:hypothetical protein